MLDRSPDTYSLIFIMGSHPFNDGIIVDKSGNLKDQRMFKVMETPLVADHEIHDHLLPINRP